MCVLYDIPNLSKTYFFTLLGSAAVLGLPQPVCHRFTDSGIPIEQAITRQRLRPGSGFLSVEIHTDGPTRVLSIRDEKEKNAYALPDEREWNSISLNQRPTILTTKIDEEEDSDKDKSELEFTLKIAGLGISIVSRVPQQELLYITFSNIVGQLWLTPDSKKCCFSVENIQCDNQLLDTPIPVFIYVTPPGSRGGDDPQNKLPALDFSAEMQPILNENAVIFRYFILRMKKMTINLEERLLLKLFAFVGFNSKDEELYNGNENDYEMQRMLTEVSGAHARRYYFGLIQLSLDQIRLSMKTASKLPPELQAIKRKLGFTFIKFEDAAVDLEPFTKHHPFETLQFLTNCIIKHFKDVSFLFLFTSSCSDFYSC